VLEADLCVEVPPWFAVQASVPLLVMMERAAFP
jgi:hypothetical protein